MKVVLWFTILITPIYLFGQQQKTYDTLTKYSYHITGNSLYDNTHEPVIDMISSEGTGFFIRRNNEIYFFTAKHVLLGCNYYGEVPPKYPHNMSVTYNNDTGRIIVVPWKYDLHKIQSNDECYPFYVSPDTISVLKDTGDMVYTIENFEFYTSILKFAEIQIWGFPTYNNLKDGGYIEKPASVLQSKKYVLDSNFKVIDKQGNMHLDSINYRLYISEFKITPILKGYSGSPVFIQNEDSKKWFFLGVVSSIDTALNTIEIVKSKYVIQ